MHIKRKLGKEKKEKERRKEKWGKFNTKGKVGNKF
jgi:hypothetical protein